MACDNSAAEGMFAASVPNKLFVRQDGTYLFKTIRGDGSLGFLMES